MLNSVFLTLRRPLDFPRKLVERRSGGIRRFALLCLAAATLSACGSGGGGSGFEIGIQLSADPVTQGVVEARFDFGDLEGIDEAHLELDGRRIANLSELDGSFFLSVTSLTDGQHELVVSGRSGGIWGSGSRSFGVRNPRGFLTSLDGPEQISPGATLRLSLEVTGSVEAVRLLPGALAPGLDAIEASQTGSRTWELSFTVPANSAPTHRLEVLPLLIEDDQARVLRVEDYRLRFSADPHLPIRADLASTEYGPFPEGSADADLTLTGLSGLASVIPGGEARLRFSSTGNLDGAQLLVGLAGHDGYLAYSVDVLRNPAGFTAPLRPGAPAAPGAPADGVEFSFHLPAGMLEAGNRGNWDLQVALRDAFGRVSDPLVDRLAFADASDGELRVSLSWDTPTDVDLYVVNPLGEEIYYGNRSDSQGGRLDLDSNAGCSIDGVNQENVYWPKAPNGEYVVRVNYWSACGDEEGGLPANWRVTVRGCGIEQEASGSFGPGDASGGASGAGQEALRFDAQCSDFRVKGTARYQRPVGATQVIRTVAAAGVPVQVIGPEDEVLGEGTVGSDGSYDLTFARPEVAEGEEPKVFLRLRAAGPTVEVLDLSDEVNVVDSETWNPVESPDHELDLLARYARSNGGALHIMRMTQQTWGWYASKGYRIDTPMIMVWERGKASSICESCFVPSTKRIYLTGTTADPDEFDDPVITHEIGHLAVDAFGRDDSPGGSHSTRRRAVQTLAWSEGFATWLGQRVLDDPLYYDRSRSGVYQRRIDDLTGIPLGASPDTPAGALSEALVSAALWDFFDPVSDAENDQLHGLDFTVLVIGLDRMAKEENLDRGIAGRADFADFVGLLACDAPSSFRDKVHTLLNERYKLDWVKRTGFCSAGAAP